MIELNNVTKKYHDITALKNFTLQIPKGILLVLLGPSGCGKSTVIKLINHLIEPTSGEIYINNKNINEINLINLRRSMGYVIQSIGLFPHYNVYENIIIVPRLLKWSKKDIDHRVDFLLDLVGLNRNYKNKFPFELSGGEGQRVGVARALAADPPILLMDEPFGSVDPLNRERLQKEFYKIQRELKKTVLFVTHDVEEAIRLADNIAVMKPGELASLGSPWDFVTDNRVDYGEILKRAEQEAEVIIWDGGNNDLPFYKPDLHIVVADPHRVGNEMTYYPGQVNLRMADVVVINKIDTAKPENINLLRKNIFKLVPGAVLIEAASPIKVEHSEMIRGKKVMIVEDGPTLTHGEMQFGAGSVAAQKYGAGEIVDPRPFAMGSIKDIYQKYPLMGKVLPAMGYGMEQIKELEATINNSDTELVIIGTPIDLSRVMHIDKKYVRVSYELQEIGSPDLKEILTNHCF
jgi:ABC-type proline/glycine betaine transport system ATPase subunit